MGATCGSVEAVVRWRNERRTEREGAGFGEVAQAALLLLQRGQDVRHIRQAQRLDGEVDGARIDPVPKSK